MTKLYQNVAALCKANKISILELERQTEIPPNTITTWRKSMPLCERVLLVANYFDVSIDFLLGNSNNPLSHKAKFCDSMHQYIKNLENKHLGKDEIEFAINILAQMNREDN